MQQNRLPGVPAPAPEVGKRFAAAGFELFLVGGAVRDQILGSSSDSEDIDLATDARPADILRLIEPIATATWRQGERFGTIGATVHGRELEITTYRSESYEPDSRKPVVGFGDDLRTDLSRRDFTINAMARDVVSGALVDPFGGVEDLVEKRLRTPLAPEISLDDDPLRMLRAARFAARLSLQFDRDLLESARRLARRLLIVSGERIFAELERLLLLPDPEIGLRFIWDAGVLSVALGDVPLPEYSSVASSVVAMRAEPPVDSAVRWAALCRLTGVDEVRLAASLRMSTVRRVELHRLLTTVLPDADDTPGLRRLLLDRGAGLPLRVVAVHRLVGAEPDDASAAFEDAYRRLLSEVTADRLRSPLGGGEVMELLGVAQGPIVGRALAHLEDLAVRHGPLSEDQARAALDRWNDSSSGSRPGENT